MAVELLLLKTLVVLIFVAKGLVQDIRWVVTPDLSAAWDSAQPQLLRHP